MAVAKSEVKQSPLSLLKYPLVFFGMCVSVVEAGFGFALNNSTSEKMSIILSSWMGGLFLVTIFIVAFLVYKVPTHIMLESQKELKEGIDKELTENYRKVEEKLLELAVDVETLKAKKQHSNKKLIEVRKIINSLMGEEA